MIVSLNEEVQSSRPWRSYHTPSCGACLAPIQVGLETIKKLGAGRHGFLLRYPGHVCAIQSVRSRLSSSLSKCRPINTKADAAGGSPAPCRTSSYWYTP